MTCAKKRVVCVITAPTGETFIGENTCNNPQTTCPRLPGEGYAKCKTICRQPGHAEEIALLAAGDKTRGATAQVFGITHYCRNCQEKLFSAGIIALTAPSLCRYHSAILTH